MEWLTDGITPPTNEEIEAEISTLAAEKEMARLKAEASRLVREARFQALGTDDPAKMAEYVDKANMALLLENGQLPEADKSKLTEDAWAQLQGITDPEEVGGIWLQKSRVLRVKRDQINRAETEANERIRCRPIGGDCPIGCLTQPDLTQAALKNPHRCGLCQRTCTAIFRRINWRSFAAP